MKKTFLLILNLIIVSLLVSGCSSCDLFSKEKLEISLNPGIDTIEIYTNFEDKGATATYGSKLVAVATDSNVDTSKLGEYTITYTATYKDQKAIIKRIVSVVDQTAPILALNPGVDTIKIGEEWNDAGVNAQDNSMTDVVITVDSKLDNTKVGEYIITYTGKDQSGNTSTIIRYVNVVE